MFRHPCTRRRLPLALAVVLTVVVPAGCDELDARPADWAFIAPVILAPNCATASCHSRGAAESGLVLANADDAYDSLFGRQAQFRLPQPPAQDDDICKADQGGTLCVTSRPLVQACRPEESRLVHMLRARGAQRMPPDVPLPLADIELIERWILAGAKRNRGDLTPNCHAPVMAPMPVPPDAGAPVDAPAPDARDATGGG